MIPDVMIICNKDIIKASGIYGVPDLVAEVLSPGTEKRDRGFKKELFMSNSLILTSSFIGLMSQFPSMRIFISQLEVFS